MNRNIDVIVVGGGAAGLIAAVTAAEKGKKTVLLEKADRTGRKILASGNGRCNIMNSGDLRYYGETEFARKVFQRCPREEIIRLFKKYGLMLREETDGRIYPVTNQSASVVSTLKNAMTINCIKAKMNSHVINAEKRGNTFFVETGDGIILESEKLIITCGGSAQPKLGGTEDGYLLLEKMGHSRIPVQPSLVPLNTDQLSISGLSGIRSKCRVHLKQDNRIIHTEDGEVLFTDYGISGICIMQCARFISTPGSYLELNLINDIFADKKEAYKELVRRRQIFSLCAPVWLLNGILPEKLSYAVLKQAGLELRGEKCGDASDEELEKVIDTAFSYRIMITGSRGFDQAQVTAGGINCGEFNQSTMESKKVKGL